MSSAEQLLTGWRLTVSKLFCIQQRHMVAIMAFFCVTIAYTLRICLNIAITQMVTTKDVEDIHDPNACPNLNSELENSTSSQGEYNWNEETQGIILSAFYYGYIVTQLPSGLLIEKYGAKHPLGIGIAITAVLTLITPVVIRAGGDNPTGLIIVRAVQGLAQGPTMPALSALMSRWIPLNERGIISSLIYGGSKMGNIMGTILSGFLMSGDGNWSNVFYIFGGLGIFWYIFWQILVYSDPRTHPYISDKEREFLESKIEKKSQNPIPWKPMLLSWAFWAILLASIGNDWGYYTLETDLPKYMNDVLKFSITATGMLSALPYLIMWVTSFIFGVICDWCITKNLMSIKNLRKLFTTLGAFVAGIFIVLASYAGCDRTIAVVMFCIVMGAMGAHNCGIYINPLDIAPNYVGVVVAVVNGISSITGVITPYLVGYFTPNQTQEEWRIAFWITFAILTVTNIFYVMFAQGDVQWWNDIEANGYPSTWTKNRKEKKINIEKPETESLNVY